MFRNVFDSVSFFPVYITNGGSTLNTKHFIIWNDSYFLLLFRKKYNSFCNIKEKYEKYASKELFLVLMLYVIFASFCLYPLGVLMCWIFFVSNPIIDYFVVCAISVICDINITRFYTFLWWGFIETGEKNSIILCVIYHYA